MRKFMLDWSFTFEAYVKNVREEVTKFSLKTINYWMLIDMCLPKFDIYW